MRLLQETFNKDDKETERIIDEQEIATESLIESSITEENKLHYELEIEVELSTLKTIWLAIVTSSNFLFLSTNSP